MSPSIHWKTGLSAGIVLVVGILLFIESSYSRSVEIAFFSLAALPYFNMKNRGFLLSSILVMQVFYVLWFDQIRTSGRLGENEDLAFAALYDNLIFASLMMSWIFMRIKKDINIKKAIILAIGNLGLYALLVVGTEYTPLPFLVVYFSPPPFVSFPYHLPISLYITIPWLIIYLVRQYRLRLTKTPELTRYYNK